MSRSPQAAPGEYPYSYTTAPRSDDGNDSDDSQERNIVRIRQSRTTSTAGLVSPLSPSMDGPGHDQHFDMAWSPPPAPTTQSPDPPQFGLGLPAGVGLGESSTWQPQISFIQPETASVRQGSPGLDSLLEPPYLDSKDFSESTTELRDENRQRALDALGGGSKGLGEGPGYYSGETIDLPDWKGKEKRRSLTAAIGEKAFKSPIIGAGHRKTQSMKLEPHQVIDQRSELVAEWGIYWYLPVLAIAAFVAGLVGALGHHAFYRSLHGQESREQLMMVRIGTAFAFFVKACLVGAVVLAYRQRIWYTMRRKALSIRTIDAMFGVVEDPTFFFTAPQMVKKSKVSSLLALATWLIPIASVLSPSSLTSDLIHVKRDTSCSVPTVDFPAENKYDYRTAQADFGNALSFYNHTDPDDRDSDLAYDMPSFMNLLVASKSVFNHGIVAPNTTPCPKSNNCTFAIVIDAPGYKCDDLIGQTPIWQRAPFNMDTLVPDGRFVYRAEVDQGDFQKPDLRPKDPNFDPEWITGTFHYEPELWIAFATRTNESLPEEERQKYKYTLKNGTTINRWQYRFERRMFRCVLHYTTYKLNFEYLNNKQNITILSTNYTRPVMETVYGENPPNRSKFMRPSNENYRLTAAYHSIAQLMRAYLRGAIYQDNDAANTEGSIPITNSTISLTNLVESETAYPVKDLDKKIQKFLQDIIFTLLTHPKKMVVTKHIQVPCMASFYQNRFQYHEKNLWIGYSIVVVGTFISIIIGGVALRSNGISSDTLFSRILVTTRNPTLDRLCRGACLGGDPFPKELEQTKLRFGVLRDTDPFTGALMESRKSLGARGLPEHCSFGTIYETSDIVKGERYAGLRNIGGRERQDCNGCGRCENGGEEDFRGEFLVEEEGGEFDEKSRQNYMDEEEEEMFYDFEGGERGSLDGADDSVETIPLLAQLR